MEKKKTILIVDDHPVLRDGLRAIIGRDTRYEVVGEAGNGREALRMTRELKPDLVLVDISLPDQTGLQLTREIQSLLSETRVIIVSMHSRVDYIVEAFQAGATGYVTKESASDKLLQGLETVSKGEHFMDSTISHKVLRRLIGVQAKETKITDAAYETLTSREQEIMVLLAEGLSTKQIGERLFISPKTVENHRSNIMNKLGLHRTIELIRYAARLGMIDVDLWKE